VIIIRGNGNRNMDELILAEKRFCSRLFVGTGKFSSNDVMGKAVSASGSELVTVALKRVDINDKEDEMISHLKLPGVNLLPNTSGVRTAKEALFAAELAREALETNWLKLEIHPDPRYLLPDHRETLKAAEELADPVFCKQLEEAGVAAVMPLGSPIGSNSGLKTRTMLEIIIEESNIPVVVDAGIGAPSQAAEAMEMGADAVLINTAIAVASDPVRMAEAFRLAVEAGRVAFMAKLGKKSAHAVASSPLTSFLDD
jgi:thiazole synthase